MATLTWIGTTSVLWDTASNWQGGVVPTLTDAVIDNAVNNADILNGTSVTVASLTIGGTGATEATVIVGGSHAILPDTRFPGGVSPFTTPGGTLNVTGALTVNSTITHQSVSKTTFLLYFPKAGATLAA